jgi:hypothetical protein
MSLVFSWTTNINVFKSSAEIGNVQIYCFNKCGVFYLGVPNIFLILKKLNVKKFVLWKLKTHV